MYRTCLFCNGDLGTNESVESFLIGRRLAFDGAKGRLWVVCVRCARWNLTPLEERWEAIERCEALYATTPRRASTENIGLARLTEGLELIRVGEAQRPEFAAWRYGRVFARRRRRAWITIGAASGAALAMFAGAGALTATFGVGAGILFMPDLPGWILALRRREARIARIALAEGGEVHLRRKHVRHTMLLGTSPSTCTICVRHGRGDATITGQTGIQVLGSVLASINRHGATAEQVAGAVHALEAPGGPEEFLRELPRSVAAPHASVRLEDGSRVSAAAIGEWDLEPRLALEMALHESTERAALDGELGLLETAWREAEEIAAIADNLLVPPGIADALGRLRVD